jgi:ABC-type amino acid transport substrate-binding protein
VAKRGLLAVSLIAVVAILLVGCGGGGGTGSSAEAKKQRIVVASEMTYRPFEYVEDGKPTGFDIDLMREVAERANLEVEFQNVQFDGIIPGLGNGLYDAAIAAITITPERRKQIDFSEPYFDADQSLLVQSGSGVKSTNDLSGRTVGVQLGTTGAGVANKLRREGKIGQVRTFDSVEDAFNALQNGQLDGVITDFPVSAERANQSDGSLKVVQTIRTGEQYGIAFPKGSDLVGRVDKALKEIKDDGTYARIYEKYFGKKPEDIP